MRRSFRNMPTTTKKPRPAPKPFDVAARLAGGGPNARDRGGMIVLGIDPGKVQTWCRLAIDGTTCAYRAHGDVSDRVGMHAAMLGADLICIEEPSSIMPSKRLETAGHRVAIGLGNGLLRTMKRVRELERVAAELGIPVVLITSTAARRAIGIKIRAGKVDAQIGRTVPRLISDWPKRSNNHTRDAAVTAHSGHAKWKREQALAKRRTS